jgi:hypothetical protein
MSRKEEKTGKDDTIYLHGNQAKSDQKKHLGHAYSTNALTQYDVPGEDGIKEESLLAVEDAKRRVDENHK